MLVLTVGYVDMKISTNKSITILDSFISTLCLRYEKGSNLNLAPQSTICSYAPGRENHFGALLNDLLKAFNCIDQKLLIAKLYGYDVSQQIFVLNMSWICLEQLFDLRLQKMSSKDVFKMSWSRPICLSWSYIFKTSSRHFQDVFKTPIVLRLSVLIIRLQDVLKKFSRCLYNVFKMFPRHLQDDFKTPYHNVFKTFSRRLQNVLQKRLQNIFKTPSRRPQKSSSHLAKMYSRYFQNVFKTFWRRLRDIINISSKDVSKTFSRCIIKLNRSC